MWLCVPSLWTKDREKAMMVMMIVVVFRTNKWNIFASVVIVVG